MITEEQFQLLWKATQWDKKDESPEWNQWRTAHPKDSIDLEDANFLGRNFSAIQLDGANLSRGVFSGANFQKTNLSGANLSGAHLQSVDFTGANFGSANLSGADLRDAILGKTTGLTADQLAVCKDLEGISGVDGKILKEVKEKSPELMMWWEGK